MEQLHKTTGYWLTTGFLLTGSQKKVLMHLPCVWETMCHPEPGEVCVPFMTSQTAFNKLVRCINQVFEISLQKNTSYDVTKSPPTTSKKKKKKKHKQQHSPAPKHVTSQTIQPSGSSIPPRPLVHAGMLNSLSPYCFLPRSVREWCTSRQ